MSNLRRSRPDEQDAALRRLQEISMIHHRQSSTDLPSPYRTQQMKDTDITNASNFHDGNCSQQQMREANLRWEKLRCILVAMKDEPLNVESCLQASPNLQMNHEWRLSTAEELQLELSALQDVLKQKRRQLQQAEEERDSALAYILHLKMNPMDRFLFPETTNTSLGLYEQGVASLRDPTVSKENVLALLSPLVKELHRHKSYLDRLTMVALMRVPWILDEVDNLELQSCKQPFLRMDDDEEGR